MKLRCFGCHDLHHNYEYRRHFLITAKYMYEMHRLVQS